MNKETRTKIPEGVTTVNVPSTGQSKISMGENVGWVTGPHDAVKAVQKLIIDGENYRKAIKDLEAELLIAENALTNARAALHGTRQHVYEVNMKPNYQAANPHQAYDDEYRGGK